MRTHHATIVAGALLGVLALSSTAGAQGMGPGMGRGRAGWGPRYDTATVQTLSGAVARVDTVPSPRGAGGGVHLQLRTERETVRVDLGPSWYLDGQALKLAAGDRITVRGSRVTLQGAPAIIASEVSRAGDATRLQLRDSRGLPAWARNAQQAAPGRRMP